MRPLFLGICHEIKTFVSRQSCSAIVLTGLKWQGNGPRAQPLLAYDDLLAHVCIRCLVKLPASHPSCMSEGITQSPGRRHLLSMCVLRSIPYLVKASPPLTLIRNVYRINVSLCTVSVRLPKFATPSVIPFASPQNADDFPQIWEAWDQCTLKGQVIFSRPGPVSRRYGQPIQWPLSPKRLIVSFDARHLFSCQ
jgi:hypothetical protein